MRLDIVYVTYNSGRWVLPCFESFLTQEYPLKLINIYVVDNASSDDTAAKLKRFKMQHGRKFGKYKILRLKKNYGFGRGNNAGFLKGESDIVCFFNIDTQLLPDTLTKLVDEINTGDQKTAIWELRQFPYEHPKLYDPVTMETTWSSGAAFAVRRTVFSSVHGFDKKLFMYAEDVDLSWRIRSFGYKIRYVPRSVIMHYSYENAGEVKPAQHVYGVIHNLYLRYRYGNMKECVRGQLKFWFLILCTPSAFPDSKKQLLREYSKHFRNIGYFLNRSVLGDGRSSVSYFKNWDYSINRDGGYYRNTVLSEMPKVSVIVRTCGRPDVLRETMISLRNQTYQNLEIVVVEDGEELSGQMLREEFGDLNLVYFPTVKKVGRSRAGNMAIEKASGDYINFLDDDDLFFADHVEVLAGELSRTDNKAVYAFAYETPVDVIRTSPYQYKIKGWIKRHTQTFNRALLCYHNYIPIQAIMFEKELFEKYGGLDESLDALEDWDLWVRYSMHTDFSCVEKTTSVYRVPANVLKNIRRQKALDDALIKVREKHKGYKQSVSAYDIAAAIENTKKR